MAYALVFHFSIGMFLERFGSFPLMMRAFGGWIRSWLPGKTSDDEDMRGEPVPDPTYFEGFQGTEDTGDAYCLEISNLVKQFELENGRKQIAVNHLNLKLYKGQIFAFLGHNGAGKTTTISMLTGMLPATSGTVKCFGKHVVADLRSTSSAQLAKEQADVKRMMGICPQHDILFDTITVQEHLEIFCDFKGVPSEQQADKIAKVMKDLGVYEHKDTLSKDLSGGNRRKLSVALALVADSKVVLLDEPTSGMDIAARKRLWSILQQYKQDRIIILTTHNMYEAEVLGDRIGIMNEGCLSCLGSSQFLKNKFCCGFKISFKCPSSRHQDLLTYLKLNLGPLTQQTSFSSTQLCFSIPKSYG